MLPDAVFITAFSRSRSLQSQPKAVAEKGRTTTRIAQAREITTQKRDLRHQCPQTIAQDWRESGWILWRGEKRVNECSDDGSPPFTDQIHRHSNTGKQRNI
jgi:predicted secreted protein